MTLCANCSMPIEAHSETKTDRCLKLLSLQFPRLIVKLTELEKVREELMQQVEMLETSCKMLKIAVDEHNCFERVNNL